MSYIRMNKKKRQQIAKDVGLYSRDLDRFYDVDFANEVFRRARHSNCIAELCSRIRKEEIGRQLEPSA